MMRNTNNMFKDFVFLTTVLRCPGCCDRTRYDTDNLPSCSYCGGTGIPPNVKRNLIYEIQKINRTVMEYNKKVLRRCIQECVIIKEINLLDACEIIDMFELGE